MDVVLSLDSRQPEETGLKEVGSTYPQLEQRVNELAAHLTEPEQIPPSPGTPDYNFYADSSAADLEEEAEEITPRSVLPGLGPLGGGGSASEPTHTHTGEARRG